MTLTRKEYDLLFMTIELAIEHCDTTMPLVHADLLLLKAKVIKDMNNVR